MWRRLRLQICAALALRLSIFFNINNFDNGDNGDHGSI
jgi:hypothetical protein